MAAYAGEVLRDACSVSQTCRQVMCTPPGVNNASKFTTFGTFHLTAVHGSKQHTRGIWLPPKFLHTTITPSRGKRGLWR